MAIQAMRKAVKDIAGHQFPSHPGLRLAKYNHALDAEGEHNEKDKIIAQLANPLSDDTVEIYKFAVKNWHKQIAADTPWCVHTTLPLRDRLFIGLGSESVLEFGVTLNHIYGFPQIPGSAMKGLCAHYANDVWGKADADWKTAAPLHRTLFGNPDTSDVTATAGAIDFFDAWWEPNSASPFTKEIINCHHQNYYSALKDAPPADWDQPIPVRLLAVSGSFLFTVRGPLGWTNLVMELMVEALSSWGVGAKTSSGYGRFKMPSEQVAPKKTIWNDVTLTFTPNNGEITASCQSKKATVCGKNRKKLVPKRLHKKLFEKKKRAVAEKVEVEPVGNAFRILKIY